MVPLIFAFEGFPFGFDLHRKFIDHYEMCILLPYYHTCQVKFKRVPNCFSSTLHSYIYTQVCKSNLMRFYLSFLGSFKCEVMLIAWLWLNWHQRCHSLPPLKRISSRDSGKYAKCGQCVCLWLVKPEGRHYYRLRVAKIFFFLSK